MTGDTVKTQVAWHSAGERRLNPEAQCKRQPFPSTRPPPDTRFTKHVYQQFQQPDTRTINESRSPLVADLTPVVPDIIQHPLTGHPLHPTRARSIELQLECPPSVHSMPMLHPASPSFADLIPVLYPRSPSSVDSIPVHCSQHVRYRLTRRPSYAHVHQG